MFFVFMKYRNFDYEWIIFHDDTPMFAWNNDFYDDGWPYYFSYLATFHHSSTAAVL